MRLYSADITGSLVVSGSLIVTGSTAANPTIINPGGDDLEGKVFIVTGSSAITRDLTVGDDFTVKDETKLEKEVKIGYQSGETNYGVDYQLNVTASQGSSYSANFDGDLLITGSLVDKDNATGTAGQVLSSTGTQLQWVANDGAGITGTGTVGNIPKFTANTVLGNSIITEAASAITVAGAGTFTGGVTSGDLILTAGTLFGAGNTGFSNRSSDTTLYLQMPATGFNITDNALNTRFILSSGGAATFNGALNGTSAKFTSTCFVNSPTNNTIITTSDATNITNGFNLLGSSSYWGIRTSSSGDIKLDVFGGGVPINALSITQSTGAATFSGNVSLESTSPLFYLNNTTSTTGKTWRLSSASNGKLFISHEGVVDAVTLEPTTGAATFSGNVGIGVSPTAKLHIQGTNSSNGGIKIQNSGGNPYGIYSDNNDLLFTNGNGVSTALTISYGGNVIIGTAAAQDFYLALRGGVGGFFGWDDSANKTIVQAPNTRSLSFQVNSDTFGNGTEAMSITSTGTAAFASPNTTANVAMVTIRSTDSQGANVGGTLGLGGSYGAGLVNYALIRGAKETGTYNDSNGYMSFTVHSSAGQVERMRIRSTGAATLTKTGSGVNDPNLSIINSDAAGHEASIYFNTQHSATDYGWKCGMNIATTTFAIGTINSSGIMSDKLAITSGGDVLINATSSIGGAKFNVQHPTDCIGLNLGPSASGTRYFMYFTYNGTNVGSIRGGPTSTAFNTTSDYRLKENVTPITDALSRINQLKPSRFNFIADSDRTVDGFLAHEVQEIIPEAISGEKDAMKDEEFELTPRVDEVTDEEGNIITEAVEAVMETRSVPDYQGIDQSKIVPLLTAAIQEQQTIIESQKSLIDGLTLRIETLEG